MFLRLFNDHVVQSSNVAVSLVVSLLKEIELWYSSVLSIGSCKQNMLPICGVTLNSQKLYICRATFKVTTILWREKDI